jgi:hypothetical protein
MQTSQGMGIQKTAEIYGMKSLSFVVRCKRRQVKGICLTLSWNRLCLVKFRVPT